jgi:hypothetical protein
MSAEERRLRQEDRLKTIRLRMAIDRELDERGITTPAEIGVAFGMPAAEAVKLMTRHPAILIGRIAARTSPCELSLDMGRRF